MIPSLAIVGILSAPFLAIQPFSPQWLTDPGSTAQKGSLLSGDMNHRWVVRLFRRRLEGSGSGYQLHWPGGG
jgi:hypothetical protein